MTDFLKRSKEHSKNVSKAAAWMERRNAGPNHWWRYWVLTTMHVDDADPSRPIFADYLAKQIFKELENRKLLIDEDENGNKLSVDSSGEPAFLMKYDIEGWDKVISDGRPIYGYFRRLKRTWISLLLMFILGLFGNSVKDFLQDATKGALIDVEKKLEHTLERPKPAEITTPKNAVIPSSMMEPAENGRVIEHPKDVQSPDSNSQP
jgi:hypothetical protein